MENPSPCTVAFQFLEDNEVKPISEYLPPESASFYVPARKIRALFGNNIDGLTLEKIFLCPCVQCEKDGGPVQERSTHFNKLREEELRGDYALIYALLIYIHRPGLIRKFQLYERKLQGTEYLNEASFAVFHQEQIDGFHTMQRRVLDTQYNFLVRKLTTHSDITTISKKELLPIKEDTKPKGEGSFAEVRCFEFQDDEYRCRNFGENVKRFARKLFKQGLVVSAAKEWNNLQNLSKGENHANLMVALGAYWHGNQFFILQEEADFSLHDYLFRGEGAIFESEELWKQIKGVADGLATLHRLYEGTRIAYHQDLKPANILIVKGIFKIADFGLLEFKPVTLPGDTSSTGIPNAHNTGYYAAPRQGKYTRDSDVWSLGCIISELATCDIRGRDGVNQYKEARVVDGVSGRRGIPSFYNGQVIKNAVLNQHKSLNEFMQSRAPTNMDSRSEQFQRKFFTQDFFTLLNSMFKCGPGYTAPSEVAVPDAGHVAETIERLREGAVPASELETRIEELNLAQHLPDLMSMNSSLMKQLEKFKQVLTRRNILKFATTRLVHLKQSTINLQGKQKAERRQMGLKRIKPFLDNSGHFMEAIKTLPDSKELMGFIWGPAKFLLEETDHREEAFRDLLDIYGQVGRSLPSLSMFQGLFSTEPELTRTISTTYHDMIQINTWLMIYFQQHLWGELFTTTWRRHKARFQSIIDRMQSRFDLIERRATVAQFEAFDNAASREDEEGSAASESENLTRSQAVYAWLKPVDMESEQDHLSRVLRDFPDTCRWVLSDDTFQEWFDPLSSRTSLPKLLWLNGKPGAGKTVLASRVIEEAKQIQPACTVVFFYFKDRDKERNTFLSMARSLLMQVLRQNRHALDYFYSKCCNSGGVPLTSLTAVKELLELALKNCNSVYIVLDGLDECHNRKERGDIVSWFRKLIENLSPDINDQIRCLFISQIDSARKDFRDLATIVMDAGNNKADIEVFSQLQSRGLIEDLRISNEQASEIASRVSILANGMFLFARLFWVNLRGQSSIDSLEHELRSFPTDHEKLDEMYARIMRRIMEKPVRAQREEALMLLGWLVSSKRSLKMHEVQIMKSIDLEKRSVQYSRRHFRVHLQDLCESLVDVRANKTVELVHMTARTYLANSGYLDVLTQELLMATLCVNYLNLPSFRLPISEQGVLDVSEQAVLDGEYGFMEYAVSYWVRHLEAGLTPPPALQDQLHRELAESLELFVDQHWNEPPINNIAVPKRTRDMLQIFAECQNYLDIENAVFLTDKEMKHFGDVKAEQSALDFPRIISAVRHQLESFARNYSQERLAEDLEPKYGINLFKCSRFSCKYFTEGFSTPEERETHIERHERPHRCTDEHCRGFKIGFSTKAQLDKHLRETHPEGLEHQNTFPTDEEIEESVRENNTTLFVEPIPDPEPLLDIEPTPPPDLQPDTIPSVPDPISSPPHLRPVKPPPTKRPRIKVSYTCEHCKKTFSKKFNWESHLATHGGPNSKQYACAHCERTFLRPNDMRRHEKTHNPDSAVTCGGILPDGRSWGCGERFARLDVLRTHHNTSVQGRKCVAERDGGGACTAEASQGQATNAFSNTVLHSQAPEQRTEALTESILDSIFSGSSNMTASTVQAIPTIMPNTQRIQLGSEEANVHPQDSALYLQKNLGHDNTTSSENSLYRTKDDGDTKITDDNESVASDNSESSSFDPGPQQLPSDLQPDEHIVNPAGWIRKLHSMEKDIVDNSVAFHSLSSDDRMLFDSASLFKAQTAIRENIQRMKRVNYFTSAMAVVVESNTRKHVASLITITEEDVDDVFRAIVTQDFQLCISHLREWGFKETCASIQQLGSDREKLLAISAAITWFLDMAIISFAGAHLERIDQKYLGKVQEHFSFSCTPKTSLVLRRRSLKCLDAYINYRPVWVFGEHCLSTLGGVAPKRDEQTIEDANGENDLYLSTTMTDFGRVWGPIWVTHTTDPAEDGSSSSKNPIILRYNLGLGCIIPWPRGPEEPAVLSDEVFAHWTNDDAETLNCAPFPGQTSNLRLLIGGSLKLSVNKDCPISSRPWSYTPRMLDQGLLSSGSVRRPIITRDSRTVTTQLSVPGIGSAGYQELFKPREGFLLRQQILAWWTYEPGCRNPAILANRIGVEVSACSENARRRRLVQILASSTMRHYLDTFMLDWEHEDSKEQYLQALMNPNVRALESLYYKEKHLRNDLGRAIAVCLRGLEHTGSPTGESLHALWCPSQGNPWTATFNYWDQHWVGMLTDTTSSCAFVVLTPQCLGMSRIEDIQSCRNRPRTSNIDLSEQSDFATHPFSVLQTAIVINGHAGMPKGLEYKDTHWSLRHLQSDAKLNLGESGSLTFLSRVAKSKRSSSSGALMQWSKNRLKMRLQKIRDYVPLPRSPCHRELVLVEDPKSEQYEAVPLARQAEQLQLGNELVQDESEPSERTAEVLPSGCRTDQSEIDYAVEPLSVLVVAGNA